MDEVETATNGRTIVKVIYGRKHVRARLLCDVLQEVPDGILSVVADVEHVLLDSLQTVIVHDFLAIIRPMQVSFRMMTYWL